MVKTQQIRNKEPWIIGVPMGASGVLLASQFYEVELLGAIVIGMITTGMTWLVLAFLDQILQVLKNRRFLAVAISFTLVGIEIAPFWVPIALVFVYLLVGRIYKVRTLQELIAHWAG